MLVALLSFFSMKASDLKLYYNKPASNWMNEALPIGNGYIGAMLFGGVEKDEIQLSEESIWSGGPNKTSGYNYGNKKDSWKHLDEIRQLLSQGNKKEAAKLASQYFVGENHQLKDAGSFGDYGSQQTLGSFFVSPLVNESSYSDYSRELDIAESISKVSYKRKGTDFSQQYFASYPSRLVVAKYSNNSSNGIDYKLEFNTPHPLLKQKLKGNSIIIEGKQSTNDLIINGEVFVKTDGKLKKGKDGYLVEKAKYIELYFSIATNYKNKYPDYRGGDYKAINKKAIEKAKNSSYDDLLAEHTKDFKSLFDRISFNLGKSEQSKLTTNERLYWYSQGANDPELETLYFQYGRYLLISSSRPGTMPAHLQGKWNNSMDAPWAADYHMNINLQMIYWPSEVGNLSECAQPLMEYINSLREPGRITAKEYFNARGWSVHTMNNPLGFTAPGWDFYWGYAPNSAAWLCDHIYKHYAYTKDESFKNDFAYPVMKEVGQFWLDYLWTDKDGTLVSSPSYSPEHGDITIGATIDQEIAYDLFTNILEIGKDMNNEKSFLDSISDARDKLSPLKIGKFGQLQEWKEDLDDPSDAHRHVSHLYALYPGKQIAPQTTPKLAEAAKRTLVYRGEEGTGWSLGWKINFWARLLDGNQSYKMIRNLLTPALGKGHRPSGAGSYSNLLCAHPPYQIDGNMGAVSGMIEMMLQSHHGYIEILPAIPSSWSNGSIKGLKAQGNFEIDIEWKDGLVKNVAVKSADKGECTIKYKGNEVKLNFDKAETKILSKTDLMNE